MTRKSYKSTALIASLLEHIDWDSLVAASQDITQQLLELLELPDESPLRRYRQPKLHYALELIQNEFIMRALRDGLLTYNAGDWVRHAGEPESAPPGTVIKVVPLDPEGTPHPDTVWVHWPDLNCADLAQVNELVPAQAPEAQA